VLCIKGSPRRKKAPLNISRRVSLRDLLRKSPLRGAKLSGEISFLPEKKGKENFSANPFEKEFGNSSRGF